MKIVVAQNNINFLKIDSVIIRKSNTVKIQICSHLLVLVTHINFK